MQMQNYNSIAFGPQKLHINNLCEFYVTGFGNTNQGGDKMHESQLYGVQVPTDKASSLA